MSDLLKINIMFSSVETPSGAGGAVSSEFDLHVFSDSACGVIAVVSGKVLDCGDLSDWGVSKGASSLYDVLSADPHTSQLLRLLNIRNSHVIGVAKEASSILKVGSLKKLVCLSSIRYRKECEHGDVLNFALEKLLGFCGLTSALVFHPVKLESGSAGSGIFSSPINSGPPDLEYVSSLDKIGFKSFLEGDMYLLSKLPKHRELKKRIGRTRTNGSSF